MGRNVVELSAPDLARFQSGSYDGNSPLTMSAGFEILEYTSDGIVPTVAQGVKSRKKTSRYTFSGQLVLGDIGSGLRQILADTENADDQRVELVFTSGSNAHIAYPSCSINVGEGSSVGDENIQSTIVDFSTDAKTTAEIRTFFNIAGI